MSGHQIYNRLEGEKRVRERDSLRNHDPVPHFSRARSLAHRSRTELLRAKRAGNASVVSGTRWPLLVIFVALVLLEFIESPDGEGCESQSAEHLKAQHHTVLNLMGALSDIGCCYIPGSFR